MNLLTLLGVQNALLIIYASNDVYMFKLITMLLGLVCVPFCLASDELPQRYGPFFYSNSVDTALFLFGEIEPKNDLHFRKALREHPEITTLVLNSPGGDVWEGLRLASIVIDKKLSTYVPKVGLSGNGSCASACSYIFLSGVQRRADGELGVHQFYSGQSEKMTKIGDAQGSAQFIVSEIMQTLSGSNVPQFVFSKMFEHSRMYYFDQNELEEIEIDGPNLNSDFRRKTNNFINFLSRQIAAARKPANQETIKPKKVIPQPMPQPKVKPAPKSRCVSAKSCSDSELCGKATVISFGSKVWLNNLFSREAKRRNLSCGVVKTIKRQQNCNTNVKLCNVTNLCNAGTTFSLGKKVWANNKYATEAKRRKLNCGIVEENAQSKPNVVPQKSLTHLSGEQLYQRLIAKIKKTPANLVGSRSNSRSFSKNTILNDVILSLQDHYKHRGSVNFWSVYGGHFAKNGFVTPYCRKGNRLIRTCGNSDAWVRLRFTIEERVAAAKMAKKVANRTSPLAYLYEDGIGVQKDILKAYDLHMQEKRLGSDYYWTDANKLIQRELNSRGANLKVDGDFGPASCRALKKIIGNTSCKGRVVNRENVIKLVNRR